MARHLGFLISTGATTPKQGKQASEEGESPNGKYDENRINNLDIYLYFLSHCDRLGTRKLSLGTYSMT